MRDLQPVTVLTAAPYILLAAPSYPVSSVKELLALARAKPNGVSYASAGNSSILHMAAELVAALSNTPMPKQSVRCNLPMSFGA